MQFACSVPKRKTPESNSCRVSIWILWITRRMRNPENEIPICNLHARCQKERRQRAILYRLCGSQGACGTLETKFLYTICMYNAKKRHARKQFLYVFCGSQSARGTLNTKFLYAIRMRNHSVQTPCANALHKHPAQTPCTNTLHKRRFV